MSLVELLIMFSAAVMILAGALTGVVQHSAQRRMTTERIQAMVAARNVLEELRTVDITVLPTLNGTGFDVPGPDGEPGGLNPLPGDADGLPGQILVSEHDRLFSIVIYRVQVLVQWSGADPKGLFSMESLMGERR